MGLYFLFITYRLHFFLSWISSLSISSSARSASRFSNHVFLGLPTGLLPSTLISIIFFTQSSLYFPITCPYHLSLPLRITVVIGSTLTSFLNSLPVFLYFMETPHIHLKVCISANDSKTEFIVFRSPQLKHDLSGLSVNVGESIISQSSRGRYLGVIFDQFLNIDDHITAIFRSTHFHIRNIDIRCLFYYYSCTY